MLLMTSVTGRTYVGVVMGQNIINIKSDAITNILWVNNAFPILIQDTFGFVNKKLIVVGVNS